MKCFEKLFFDNCYENDFIKAAIKSDFITASSNIIYMKAVKNWFIKSVSKPICYQTVTIHAMLRIRSSF
jgi:hypothetical protein